MTEFSKDSLAYSWSPFTTTPEISENPLLIAQDAYQLHLVRILLARLLGIDMEKSLRQVSMQRDEWNLVSYRKYDVFIPMYFPRDGIRGQINNQIAKKWLRTKLDPE